MDVLKKIDDLRRARGWSIYRLAEEAGLMQSTVSNMFYRNSVPSIYTLSQICSAFDISLSQFFSEESLEFSNDEMHLVSMYKKLPPKEKKYISQIVGIMSK